MGITPEGTPFLGGPGGPPFAKEEEDTVPTLLVGLLLPSVSFEGAPGGGPLGGPCPTMVALKEDAPPFLGGEVGGPCPTNAATFVWAGGGMRAALGPPLGGAPGGPFVSPGRDGFGGPRPGVEDGS